MSTKGKGKKMEENEQKENAGRSKERTIIVNAQKKTTIEKDLSFDEIVELAYPGGPRGGDWVYTVTYRRAHGNKSGTLVAGESLKIKDGMVFDVTQTDKS